MGTILIEQIQVDCIIGVYDSERTTKQPLFIDIEINYDSSKACQSDNLKYAIDYFDITQDIHDFVSQTQYQLIEALASSIADRILLNNCIENTTISISKPEALDKAKTVKFSLLRERE
ncbi:MAG: dihydroneopterin aldolase [Marinicellaceae bacterium]